MDSDRRRTLIDQYRGGVPAVERALEGISEHELDRTPVFRAVRDSTSELLDLLGDDDWARAGTHSESGAFSPERWLEIYADHAVTHADQIARARTGAA